MTRTLAQIAVLQMTVEKIKDRAEAIVDSYDGHDDVEAHHRRAYVYSIQCDTIISSLKVLGHLMEDNPDDLDTLDED